MESISFTKIGKAVGLAYKGFDYTKNGIANLEFNRSLSKDLYSRCCDIAEDLQQIEYRIINTGRAQILRTSVEHAIELCKKYDKKNKVKRFFSSTSDKKVFEMQHIILHLHFVELCCSTFLTDEFPNQIEEGEIEIE